MNSLRSLIAGTFADGFEVVDQLLERFDENLTWPVDREIPLRQEPKVPGREVDVNLVGVSTNELRPLGVAVEVVSFGGLVDADGQTLNERNLLSPHA